MSSVFLETPIEYLKGVGSIRAEVLKSEVRIFTFADLLTFFPFRYVDRSKFYRISEIRDESTYIQLKVRLERIQTVGKPHAQRLIASAKDSSGVIELVWFQVGKWISGRLNIGEEYIVFGKPVLFNGRWNIPHPEMEIPSELPLSLSETMRPIYSSTEKLKSKGLDYKGIGKLMKNLICNEKFHVLFIANEVFH